MLALLHRSREFNEKPNGALSAVAKSLFVNAAQSSHSTDGTGQLRDPITGNDASLEETKADGASPPKQKELAMTQLEVKSLEIEEQSQPRATPTKSGPSVRPDRTLPNLPVLGRNVRLVVLRPDYCGLEYHDVPRPGSLAEVVKQTEKAEAFCLTHRAEVANKWMLDPLPPSHID